VPIYEYRCEACGHQEEHLQKVSDTPMKKCPACGKSSYRKLLSAAGFQLKGSGWYATDFKSTAKKPAESKSADSKPESKSDSKSETKSEPKAEPKPKAA
jgi:putative FmdB family regulatory protein